LRSASIFDSISSFISAISVVSAIFVYWRCNFCPIVTSVRFSCFWHHVSRVGVTLDAGLDRWVDLLHIHQADLQLIITLWILLKQPHSLRPVWSSYIYCLHTPLHVSVF
jgi:hypothetical protein